MFHKHIWYFASYSRFSHCTHSNIFRVHWPSEEASLYAFVEFGQTRTVPIRSVLAFKQKSRQNALNYLKVGCYFLTDTEVSLLSHLLVAGCDIGVRFSVRLSVRQSVRPSVRPSVNIYVEVRHLCQS